MLPYIGSLTETAPISSGSSWGHSGNTHRSSSSGKGSSSSSSVRDSHSLRHHRDDDGAKHTIHRDDDGAKHTTRHSPARI